ncbi:hypothetical protein COU88_03085 [Candidatus Roizmanbacteria bacterium CG10_big_fil_rev_8_21_14_0_10_39_6]|uniref:N-acetyltransferase domain-containing protein n=1 Tax=Candidatus Roizmanbacteria bacterium CG10_big_fil_rev_8_21_14_0_10_39_6 TaxID=1974853 RepID=A0A2M8KSC5_9BACT|nr:MAG: hypothetical protein COU88_03085 [Candidatus Roizmanbacteria bacterium CG10_big_fil_rev_8_21_14_0_10_39_6]
MKIEQKETFLPTYDTYTYQSQQEATEVYYKISNYDAITMASVYQKAFSEAPWYERYCCTTCGSFLKEPGICTQCTSEVIQKAYPVGELVSEYFPKMLGEYAPGMITLARNRGKIVGFTTGGMVTLENIVDRKYKNNPFLLADITRRCDIDPATIIFYDNETCINPAAQQMGLGRELSRQRINVAKELGAEYICGRTINMPWLRLKERQLTEAGYSFTAFVPSGETYQVESVLRRFYFARQNK